LEFVEAGIQGPDKRGEHNTFKSSRWRAVSTKAKKECLGVLQKVGVGGGIRKKEVTKKGEKGVQFWGKLRVQKN